MLYKCWLNKRVLVAQLLTLSDPMDCNPPGASVHGIFQARILWVVIAFFRGLSQPRNQTWVSCNGRQILYHLSYQRNYLLFLFSCQDLRPGMVIFLWSILNLSKMAINKCQSLLQAQLTLLKTGFLF